MYEQFKKQKLIKIEKDRNYNTIDDMLITLAYTFDINFKESYKYIKEQDYINKIMQRFKFKNIETKEKVKELINLLNKYIENESKYSLKLYIIKQEYFTNAYFNIKTSYNK